jgi:hypothetical protein
MERLLERELVEAFALSRARGAELLERLGDFNVWNGDLATMRDDEPQGPREVKVEKTPEHESRKLVDALLLARAIELLQPTCRAALSSTYAHPADTGFTRLPEDEERLVTNCQNQLLEIYESLVQSSGESRAVPNWVSERERVAAGGTRRR